LKYIVEIYRRCGKIGKSAQAIGMTRFGFKERINVAHQDYVESLEEDMDDVCADRKGNHDILRIFRLKAEHPQKYREDVSVVGIDSSKLMLDKLREMAAKDLKQTEEQKALEAPSVEAVFKEVPQLKPEGVWTPPPNEAPPVPPESPPRESPRESARARRAAQVRAAQAARRQPSGRMIRR
jgi:hypothetical protein